ncbi:MAG: DUF6152 family protein [Bryobacteraceae bacterium]
MRLKFVGVLAVVGMFVSTVPLSAHHSFAAEYDSKTMLTLVGTISKVEWTNPHVYVHIDVKDSAGKVVSWALEGYPPNTLKRTGFARASLVQGDQITVTAYKAKDGSNTGAGRELTFKDGSKKFLGPVGN